MKRPMEHSSRLLKLFLPCLVIGTFVVALVAFFLGDRYGRRRTMRLVADCMAWPRSKAGNLRTRLPVFVREFIHAPDSVKDPVKVSWVLRTWGWRAYLDVLDFYDAVKIRDFEAKVGQRFLAEWKRPSEKPEHRSVVIKTLQWLDCKYAQGPMLDVLSEREHPDPDGLHVIALSFFGSAILARKVGLSTSTPNGTLRDEIGWYLRCGTDVEQPWAAQALLWAGDQAALPYAAKNYFSNRMVREALHAVMRGDDVRDLLMGTHAPDDVAWSAEERRFIVVASGQQGGRCDPSRSGSGTMR